MNYSITPDSDQPKFEAIAPSIPLFREIPEALRPYPSWVSWDYHRMMDGTLTRIPIGEAATVETAYKRCMAEHLGLGFRLTEVDPFACIRIADYFDTETGKNKPTTSNILSIANTYAECDTNSKELFIVGVAGNAANCGIEAVSLHYESIIVPIAGDRITPYEDIQQRDHEFVRIARRFCTPGWMHRVEAIEDDIGQYGKLARVLDECLNTPYWLEDAENSDLYTFLAHCWQYDRLRIMIYSRARSDYMRKGMINALVAEIEREVKILGLDTKVQEEQEPKAEAEDGAGSSVDVLISEGWMNDLHFNAKGTEVKEGFYNVALALEHHQDWEGRFSFDSFLHQALLDAPDGKRPISDADEADIIMWFGHNETFQFDGN